MALLSWSGSVSRGVAKTMTLDKSALSASISAAGGGSYWATSGNIQKAIVFYESTTGSQKEPLTFDYTQSSPTADFLVSAHSRDDWEISKVVLFDFDNDSLSISKAVLQANVSGGISGLNISFAPVLSGYEAAVMADSPYFFYRFQETSGTSIADSSGNSHTATIAVVGSSVLNQSGAVTGGKSIYVDNTRIETPATGSATPLSIEMWFKSSDSSGDHSMIAHGDILGVILNPNYPTHHFLYRYGGYPTPGMRIKSEVYSEQSGGTVLGNTFPDASLADGNWHHFVYTQGASQRVFYIDGTAVATDTSSFTAHDSPVPWHIGKYLNYYFTGNISEVAFYQTELSAARVLAHYSAA